MSGIFRDRFRGFVYVLMALFILLAVLNLCHRFFDHDEFEHIHSAWYAARGALPYRDFFQVHHPLLWFLLAPFIWIGGSALPSLFILRGVMLTFSLGSTVLVYRLARETSRSKEVGRLAALLLLLATLLIPRPFKQNFLLPLALLCIPAAWGLKLLCFRFRWGYLQKIRLLSVIIIAPFLILTVMIFLPNRPQMQRIQYVLEHSAETDLVYDGDIKFNVFRPDLHYMWYGLGRGKEFDAYNRVTNNQYGDYDICQLIRQKRPKFISNFFLDIHHCGLQNLYRPTPYTNLYIRAD